jgi:hypothetical protein
MRLPTIVLAAVAAAGLALACDDQEADVSSQTEYSPRILCDGVLCPATSTTTYEYSCEPDPSTNCVPNSSMLRWYVEGWYCVNDQCVMAPSSWYGPGFTTALCP